MAKATANAVVTVESDDFKLELPEPFDLKPAYTVNLPNKWRAEIYTTVVKHDRYSRNELKETSAGWRAVVVTSKGKRSDQYRGDITTSDPLELSLWLKSIAQELSKKRSTKTVVQMIEGDDE